MPYSIRCTKPQNERGELINRHVSYSASSAIVELYNLIGVVYDLSPKDLRDLLVKELQETTYEVIDPNKG